MIEVGEFSYLLRNPFFFFKIRFNHISKTSRIYLDHHFIVKMLTFLLQSRSFSTILSGLKVYQTLFVHSFLMSWRNRCFDGLSLISILLWDYCETNIKTFWYHSYENKRIISRKVVRLIFLRLPEAFPPVGLYLFS